MKRFYTLSVLGALVAWFAGGNLTRAAGGEPEGGTGLAIVYDTSGSMRQPVKNAAGKDEPKFEIANRAFLSIVSQVETFHKAHADAGLQTGLVVFTRGGARWAVPFGKFDPDALRGWIAGFSKPDGDTPLGEAVSVAANSLQRSPLKRRHILVVTDGQNTSGRDPVNVISELRRSARGNAPLGIHFVAFDVAATVFAQLKKLDVTVVPAANEKQLGEQLTFILEQKVLLEDEEAPRARP